MRKETRRICTAFIEGRTAKAARTETDGDNLYLHGHRIAWWDTDEAYNNSKRILHICFCGYPTVTTKDRLNGLFWMLFGKSPFFTSNFQLYFDSKLRPVDDYEVMTFDVDLMEELANDNTITPKQFAA